MIIVALFAFAMVGIGVYLTIAVSSPEPKSFTPKQSS